MTPSSSAAKSKFGYLALCLGIVSICLLQLWGGIAVNSIYRYRDDVSDSENDSPCQRTTTTTAAASLARREMVENWLDNVVNGGRSNDTTTCSFAFQQLRAGAWQDPNQDQLLYRRMKSPPHFLISLHNMQYDKVRYRSIYKEGEYYELDVRDRFEFILQEENSDNDSAPSSLSRQQQLPLVLDIGGNIGFYSLLSAAYGHAVLTFEINPANIVRICESLHLNSINSYGWFQDHYYDAKQQQSPPASSSSWKGMAPVRIHQQGVSNVTGMHIQVMVPGNPGQTTLDNDFSGAAGSTTKNSNADNQVLSNSNNIATERSFTTTTITLDDFADQRNWFQQKSSVTTNAVVFSIVKIDTEGHELAIVQGAQRFLQAKLAKNVLIEYRPHCRLALDILLNAGYVMVVEVVAEKEDEEENGVSSITNTATSNTNEYKMLTRQESTTLADQITDELLTRERKPKYHDFWFRLATLPLPNQNA